MHNAGIAWDWNATGVHEKLNCVLQPPALLRPLQRCHSPSRYAHAQALDERSLLLTVDELGDIKAVSSTPSLLFGFNADMLLGHNVGCCVASLQGKARVNLTMSDQSMTACFATA